MCTEFVDFLGGNTTLFPWRNEAMINSFLLSAWDIIPYHRMNLPLG